MRFLKVFIAKWLGKSEVEKSVDTITKAVYSFVERQEIYAGIGINVMKSVTSALNLVLKAHSSEIAQIVVLSQPILKSLKSTFVEFGEQLEKEMKETRKIITRKENEEDALLGSLTGTDADYKDECIALFNTLSVTPDVTNSDLKSSFAAVKEQMDDGKYKRCIARLDSLKKTIEQLEKAHEEMETAGKNLEERIKEGKPSDQTKDIVIGMSKSKVLDILGGPDNTRTTTTKDKIEEFMIYNYPNGSFKHILIVDKKVTYIAMQD